MQSKVNLTPEAIHGRQKIPTTKAGVQAKSLTPDSTGVSESTLPGGNLTPK